MEFILILFLHFLGDYAFQPTWIKKNKIKKHFYFILHILIYSVTLYIGLPLIVLFLQIFSGLPMVEFLTTYELTAIHNWNFDLFLYILLGHLLVDIWTHRLSKYFHNKFLSNGNTRWENLSFSIEGLDQFLHILHIFILYNVIFL